MIINAVNAVVHVSIMDLDVVVQDLLGLPDRLGLEAYRDYKDRLDRLVLPDLLDLEAYKDHKDRLDRLDLLDLPGLPDLMV